MTVAHDWWCTTVRSTRPTVLVAVALLLLPNAVAGESLSDALALAYATNPRLLAARADLRITDERYVQARSGLGPTVSLSASETTEHADVTQPSLFGPTSTTSYRASTPTARLSVDQTIFASGRLSASISAAEADVLAGRQTLRRTEIEVLTQVVTAYADVVLAGDLRDIARQNVDMLTAQSAEIVARQKVRDATVTDRAQADARLLAARIRLRQADAQLTDSAARYLAVVGEAPGRLEPPTDLPGIPPSLAAACAAGEAANPAYLAARFTEIASRERVRQARAAYGPTASVGLRLSREPVAGYLDQSRIDSAAATVTIDQPLFTSGLRASRVREAREVNNGDALRVAESRRQLLLDVTAAWTNLATSRGLLADLREQLTLEQRAFEGSRIEQRIGLRNTIEVLNAEEEYQATKVSLAQSYHDEYIGRVSLLAAMGVMTAELVTDAAIYRPEARLKRVASIGALPWNRLVAAIDGLGVAPLRFEPSDRDPLGTDRLRDGSAMPAAPLWDDLARILTTVPARR